MVLLSPRRVAVDTVKGLNFGRVSLIVSLALVGEVLGLHRRARACSRCSSPDRERAKDVAASDPWIDAIIHGSCLDIRETHGVRGLNFPCSISPPGDSANVPSASAELHRDRGTLQIVYGLLCAADGCPVAIEVFDFLVDPNRLRFTQIALIGAILRQFPAEAAPT